MSKNTQLGNLVNGIYVDSTGKVGVGTTSPSELLTISAAQPNSVINYTSASDYGRIYFSEAGTFKASIQFMGSTFAATSRRNALEIVNTTTGDLALGTGDARTFYIKNGGNVGIGTSIISQNFSGYTHLDIGNSTTGGILLFSNAGGTNYGYVNADSGGINMRATVGNITFNSGASERMRITSAGNVGIGNTSPSTKLHVTGTISANDMLLAGSNSWSYTTNSSWTSHQLIIPSGTLSPGGTYLIRIQYGSGDAPYIVYATGLWQPVQSNGGSADTEVLLLSSSHQGVGTAIYIRNQSVGGQAASALYARLANFPSTVGSITTTATRLM